MWLACAWAPALALAQEAPVEGHGGQTERPVRGEDVEEEGEPPNGGAEADPPEASEGSGDGLRLSIDDAAPPDAIDAGVGASDPGPAAGEATAVSRGEPRARPGAPADPGPDTPRGDAPAGASREDAAPEDDPTRPVSSEADPDARPPDAASSDAPEDDPGWRDRLRSVIDLHGDFRLRLERWQRFHLGLEDGPFDRFRAATADEAPAGGCGGERETCGGSTLRFATLRLRLAPRIHVTDDISVHALFDAFDDRVLGADADDLSLPETQRAARGAVAVRRVWARFRLRGVGELRAGRMGARFGLGLVQDDGMDLDDDASTDVDRIEARVPLGPLVLRGAWDFAARGDVGAGRAELPRVPFDPSPEDDVRQWTLAVAHRLAPAEAEARLARGDVLLEGAAQLLGRRQHLAPVEEGWARRGARVYTPDVWLRLRWRGFRAELEAAAHVGRVEDATDEGRGQRVDLRQLGVALQLEQRLLDDRLRLDLGGVYASGDGALGVAGEAELQDAGATASRFAIHPSHRVDEILWRRLVGRVQGAWVLRAGGRYDLLRDARGRGLGVTLHGVYSRASAGPGDRDLGLEVDAGLEYGTEAADGEPGAYLAVRYGVLVPLAGLDGEGEGEGAKPAQALRAIIGARF